MSKARDFLPIHEQHQSSIARLRTPSTMRIHLPLHPHHFAPAGPSAVAGPSSSPLVNIGGDLVLLELQGEVGWEGDRSDGVIGVLGLDRPDKPTLHLGEHHLLHGKISTLAKPYAVIRRVVGTPGALLGGEAVEGDAEEELSDDGDEDEDEDEGAAGPPRDTVGEGVKGNKGKGRAVLRRQNVDEDEDDEDEEEEDEPPLFPTSSPRPPLTPTTTRHPPSSSPYYPPSSIKDYSSDLDPGSPFRDLDGMAKRGRADSDGDEEEGVGDEENRGSEEEQEAQKDEERLRERARRKRVEKGRTRHYEVVGVVRKKVVFALRPEPIVTATVLPD